MPSEMEVFKELLLSFKLEIHNDLKRVTDQIEKLNTKIEDFQKQTGSINIEIGVLKERQKNIKADLDSNFKQHESFYSRLGDLEKLPDFSKRIDLNDTKTENNENNIIKIQTTAKTAYIIFGIIIALLGLAIRLKIL